MSTRASGGGTAWVFGAESGPEIAAVWPHNTVAPSSAAAVAAQIVRLRTGLFSVAVSPARNHILPGI